MNLFNIFQSEPKNQNIITPIPFVDNLWNHEWHAINFKVAGVTFENRQSILKQLDNGKLQSIYFKKSTYEEEPCVEVYANSKMIGYVPKNRLNEFLKWSDKPCSIKYKKIALGESTYGCTITIVFQKSSNNQ